MEDWEKDIINEMHTSLIAHTQCSNIFLSRFLTAKIITEEEYNRLIHMPHQPRQGTTDQNAAFYNIIKLRLGAFKQLQLSLQATSQSGLASKLSEFIKKHNPEENSVNASNERAAVVQLPAPLPINSDGNGLSSCVSKGAKGGNPYKFSKNGKRFILPINIVDFGNEKYNRTNAIIDMNNIKRLFPTLGYEVYPPNIDQKLRYSKADILDKIHKFKAVCGLFEAESCILFIGSHGADDKIFSSDGDFVRINKHIVQEFYHDNFPCMKGKPKIIIIQACREFDDKDAFFKLSDNDEENDNIREGAISDTVIIHSQVPGLPSTRNNRVGSWLVHYITEVFEKKSKNTSVMDMLKEVQDKVNENNRNLSGQIPEISDLGYKDFQLNE